MPGMSSTLPSRRQGAGFTLLELMIALAIVAIIGAIAMPSYQSSIRKGRRADAADAVSAVLQAQERWRANNPSYTASFSSLKLGTTSGGGYYTLALSSATGTGYTLSVTPVAGKGQDKDTGCTTLAVTLAGGSPSYTPAKCWSR